MTTTFTLFTKSRVSERCNRVTSHGVLRVQVLHVTHGMRFLVPLHHY
jgi:hypothetical protein